MRQLTFVSPGNLEWWDVPSPRIEAPTDALVLADRRGAL